MESKFHRWWLGSCVAALLLASWAGGFSVAVTAVFVVIYLTGVTLVGRDDEADDGLAAEPPREQSVAVPVPEPVAATVSEPAVAAAVAEMKAPPAAAAAAVAAEDDAQPYPDDDAAGPEQATDIITIGVETADAVDTAAVVITPVVDTDEAADIAAVVDIEPDAETAAIVVEAQTIADTEAVVDIEPDAETAAVLVEALDTEAGEPEPSCPT